MRRSISATASSACCRIRDGSASNCRSTCLGRAINCRPASIPNSCGCGGNCSTSSRRPSSDRQFRQGAGAAARGDRSVRSVGARHPSAKRQPGAAERNRDGAVWRLCRFLDPGGDARYAVFGFCRACDRHGHRPCARHCLRNFRHAQPPDGSDGRGDQADPLDRAAADRADRARFRLSHGNSDRGVCLRLAGPDPLPRRGAQHRAAADGSGAGAAAAAGATGLEDHHPGGAAADLRRLSAVGWYRVDRRRDGRNRDQSARPRRRHHAGAAGAAPRPDVGLSGLDRHHRLRAERPSDRSPEPPVRPRRVEWRRPMKQAVIIWRVASFAIAAGFIALWQFLAHLKMVSPVFLPGPDRARASLVPRFSTGDLWSKLAGTLEHMAYGWLAASIAGIAIGAIIGSSRTMRTYVAPSLEFLRPLPVSAIIPVAIAMLGLTQAMALFVIAFGAIWPIMLATIHGFAAGEPRLYEVARSLQMSRLAVISKIALPSASPDIFAGMRLSLTGGLILSVGCEILARPDGLGPRGLSSGPGFRSAHPFSRVI